MIGIRFSRIQDDAIVGMVCKREDIYEDSRFFPNIREFHVRTSISKTKNRRFVRRIEYQIISMKVSKQQTLQNTIYRYEYFEDKLL